MFQSWRGTVGYIKPSYRPGSLEEFIRLLPEGIGIIPLIVGIRAGTEEEFHKVLPIYKDKVAELAGLGVDLVDIGGAPPMMVHGLSGEEKIVRELEERHKVPIITSGTCQIAAFKALGVKSFVGVTYFNDSLNEIFSRYFTEAGFHVAAMEGIPVAFSDVQKLSPQEIYFYTRGAFLKHKDVDAIYMLGGGWRLLEVVRLLEQDLQVPVVYDTAAKLREVQKRLHVNQPIRGYGQLLEKLP
jgi:maleate isomerase